MASPTCRRRRFRSLLASNSAFRRSGDSRAGPFTPAAGGAAGGARVQALASMMRSPFYRRDGELALTCSLSGIPVRWRPRCRRSSSPIRKAAAARRPSRPMSPAGSRASGSMWRCRTSIRSDRRRNGWRGVRSCFRRSSRPRPPRSRRKRRRAVAQWLVVDTPAGLHGDDLRDAVRRADVMLVPLTPSAFDMAATAAFPGGDPGLQGRAARASSRSASSRCASMRAR